MQRYRVFTYDTDGNVIRSDVVQAVDDAQALERSEKYSHHHDVEVFRLDNTSHPIGRLLSRNRS
jgi:hypothetical protein